MESGLQLWPWTAQTSPASPLRGGGGGVVCLRNRKIFCPQLEPWLREGSLFSHPHYFGFSGPPLLCACQTPGMGRISNSTIKPQIHTHTHTHTHCNPICQTALGFVAKCGPVRASNRSHGPQPSPQTPVLKPQPEPWALLAAVPLHHCGKRDEAL